MFPCSIAASATQSDKNPPTTFTTQTCRWWWCVLYMDIVYDATMCNNSTCADPFRRCGDQRSNSMDHNFAPHIVRISHCAEGVGGVCPYCVARYKTACFLSEGTGVRNECCECVCVYCFRVVLSVCICCCCCIESRLCLGATCTKRRVRRVRSLCRGAVVRFCALHAIRTLFCLLSGPPTTGPPATWCCVEHVREIA